MFTRTQRWMVVSSLVTSMAAIEVQAWKRIWVTICSTTFNISLLFASFSINLDFLLTLLLKPLSVFPFPDPNIFLQLNPSSKSFRRKILHIYWFLSLTSFYSRSYLPPLHKPPPADKLLQLTSADNKLMISCLLLMNCYNWHQLGFAPNLTLK